MYTLGPTRTYCVFVCVCTHIYIYTHDKDAEAFRSTAVTSPGAPKLVTVSLRF